MTPADRLELVRILTGLASEGATLAEAGPDLPDLLERAALAIRGFRVRAAQPSSGGVAFAARWSQVMAAVLDERAFQIAVYPRTVARPVSSHVLVMEQELLEARVEAVRGSSRRSEALKEVLQVTACGVACLMDHGVRERDYVSELVERQGPVRRSVEEARRRLAAARESVVNNTNAGAGS